MSPLTPENSTVSVPVTVSFHAVTLDSEASHSHSPGLAEPLPVPESALGSLLAGRMSTEQTLSLQTVCVPHLSRWPICVPWEMASPRPAPPREHRSWSPVHPISCCPQEPPAAWEPCCGRSWKAHSFHTGCQGPLGPAVLSPDPLPPCPCLPSSPPLSPAPPHPAGSFLVLNVYFKCPEAFPDQSE